MKLFKEAGATANIGVQLYRTNFNGSQQSQALRYMKYIVIGLVLGELLVIISGMNYSWALFAGMGVMLVVAYGIVILRSLFRKQRILMAFIPERNAGNFLISPNQILWASPMGDIPIFDHHGYKVQREDTPSGIHYICIGKTGPAMRHEMQRIMPEERIWECQKLVFEFGPQLEQYPEAMQVLEKTNG